MKLQRRPSPAARKLLAAFAANPADWRHGYDLTKETGVGAGTLYPLLDRWASHGILHSEWHVSDAPGRPARHAYRLTSQGVALARNWPMTSNIDVSLQPRTA